MEKLPLVSIDCITYNHAPYIRQCLGGFLMQKTNFSFEVLIHDDASTDGTSDIIREYELKYPEIIKPIYQTENQWSKGISISTTFNFPRAKGKYIALCEGDDYWIDPFKLQKQIDFLETHTEYGLCHTSAKIYNTAKRKFETRLLGNAKNSFEDLLCHSHIATLTTCFRKELLLSYINTIIPYSQSWQMGDYPLWLWFSLKSKIAFLPEVTAVYNILSESVSHSMNTSKRVLFCFSSYEIASFFASRYLENEKMEKFVNVRFTSLILSIVKHRTFNLFVLLVNTFDNQSYKLNIYNRILFFLIRKICCIVF